MLTTTYQTPEHRIIADDQNPQLYREEHLCVCGQWVILQDWEDHRDNDCPDTLPLE